MGRPLRNRRPPDSVRADIVARSKKIKGETS
jgi:hypothetical protein